MTAPQKIENTTILWRRRVLVALGVFIGIVAAVNWQLIIHLSTHFVGRPFEDAFEVLWEVELLREWSINYVIINGTSDERFLKETLPSIQAVRGLCLVRTDDEAELRRHTYVFEILGIDQQCTSQS